MSRVQRVDGSEGGGDSFLGSILMVYTSGVVEIVAVCDSVSVEVNFGHVLVLLVWQSNVLSTSLFSSLSFILHLFNHYEAGKTKERNIAPRIAMVRFHRLDFRAHSPSPQPRTSGVTFSRERIHQHRVQSSISEHSNVA